jgi:hypothetical protein
LWITDMLWTYIRDFCILFAVQNITFVLLRNRRLSHSER